MLEDIEPCINAYKEMLANKPKEDELRRARNVFETVICHRAMQWKIKKLKSEGCDKIDILKYMELEIKLMVSREFIEETEGD